MTVKIPRKLAKGRAVTGVLIPAGVVLSALLVAVAIQISRAESAGRSDLRDRFALRTTLASQFAESYTRELQARERREARRWLSADRISRTTFEQVASAMGFDAAVLLDRGGRVLAVIPRKDALLGKVITAKYPHLQAAVQGRTALSPIVLSAARHELIIASAVPYPTKSGRRVFSAGFAIAATPLAAYLRTTASIPGSAFALVDDAGNVVVGSATADAADAAGVLRGTISANGYYVTAADIKGAPWKIAAAVPTNQLYAPVGHHRFFPWLIFGAFAAAAMTALTLLLRLIRRSEKLQQTLEELERSHFQIRKLQELSPLCMICNQIHRPDETWEPLLDYLARDGLLVSHGYCPDCAQTALAVVSPVVG